MKSLFDFQKIFEVVTNGIPDLTHNATEAREQLIGLDERKTARLRFIFNM